MDYAQRQRSPLRHLASIAVVVILHILAGYVLVNSRTRNMQEAAQSPLEIMLIQEIKKLPLDDTPSPPPRKMKLPPAFVPQPEVQIQIPPEPLPTISNITNVVTPVLPASPGRKKGRGGAGTGVVEPNVGDACPNSQSIRSEIAYPEQARRDRREGKVLIEFTLLADGSIKDIDIMSSSDRVFNNASVNAVRRFICSSQDSEVRVSVPFVFKLDN